MGCISFSRRPSWPRDWTQVSHIVGRCFTVWATREVQQVICPLIWTFVWSLMQKEMATHSSILAWRIPWTEEPRGLQSTGLQRVGHDWATLLTYLWSLNPWVVWVYLSWTLILTISVYEHLHPPQTVRTGLPGTQQSELKIRWKARIYIGRIDRCLVRHEWVSASFWMESSSPLQPVHWWSWHAQRSSPFCGPGLLNFQLYQDQKRYNPPAQVGGGAPRPKRWLRVIRGSSCHVCDKVAL